MKKLFTLLTILVMCFLIGCKKTNSDAQRTLKVLLPSGTPVMAIGSLIGDSRFEFQIVNGQEPLQAAFLEAKYDLIIAPFNLGAKLFLAGKSQYKVESIITTNNTYVISRTQINDVHDLENKKVMTFGKGSSPWLAYKAIDDKYNLNIQEVPQSSAGDVATLFANGSNDADFFLCAEPNITQLKEVNKLDLTNYPLVKQL